MNKRLKNFSRHLFFFLALFLGLIFLLIQATGLFSPVETRFSDFWFHVRGESQADPNIVIVEIDDASQKALGKKWPWNRQIIAEGVRAIAAQSPKAIGIDLIFSEPSENTEDLVFSKTLEELQKKTPVILASSFEIRKEKVKSAGERTVSFQESLESPIFNTKIGFVNIYTDEGQIIRRFEPLREFQNQKYLFFSFALAMEVLKIKNSEIELKKGQALSLPGKRKFPLSQNNTLRINFPGLPGSYPKISFFQVFSHQTPENFLKDKIVLLGPSLSSVNDYHLTPYSSEISAKSTGVEILAAILDNFLNQRFLSPASSPVQTILIFLLMGALFLLYFQIKKPLLLFILSLSFAALYFFWAGFSFIALNQVYFLFVPLAALIFTGFFLTFALAQKKTAQLLEELKNQALMITGDLTKKYGISQREKEIIELVCQGIDNSQISKKLFISLSTVKKHIYNIYQKTGVKRREDLIELIREHNQA